MENLADVEEYKAVAAQLADVAVQYGFNLLSAILIVIAGFVVAGWLSALVHRRLTAIRRFDKTLVPVLSQIVRYAVLVFTLILVLAEFGIQTASIIAVLGAAGLAIGLALQGTLQNVAAGMMLLMLRPFHVGDFISMASGSGTVEEIGIFITTLRTAQGIYVAVPNSQIWSDAITNFSRYPNRRLDLDIGISYEGDIDKARNVILKMAKADERVNDDPEPVVVVTALGASAVNLQLRAWIRRTEYLDASFDLTRKSKYALDKAGIMISHPYTQIIPVRK